MKLFFVTVVKIKFKKFKFIKIFYIWVILFRIIIIALFLVFLICSCFQELILISNQEWNSF